jgi:hypothetical protein
VGAYLPLSTTLPIFVGGAIKGVADWVGRRKGVKTEESELGTGSLFATGLVAGGALAGVIVALLSVNDNIFNWLAGMSAEHGLTEALGSGGYAILGVIFFALMGVTLYRVARKPQIKVD